MTNKLAVTKISVTIVSKPGLITKINEYIVETIPIIADNEDLYCLGDHFFTTIAKTKKYDWSRNTINKPSISFSTGDSVWGTSVRYTLFTFKGKKPETIKKEIREAITDKYGDLFNVNLDFITDRYQDTCHTLEKLTNG
jgi:hypothetical protein